MEFQNKDNDLIETLTLFVWFFFTSSLMPKDQSCKQAGLFLSQHLYMLSGAELLKQTEDGLPPGSLSLCYNERAVWFQQPSHAVISYIKKKKTR